MTGRLLRNRVDGVTTNIQAKHSTIQSLERSTHSRVGIRTRDEKDILELAPLCTRKGPGIKTVLMFAEVHSHRQEAPQDADTAEPHGAF